MNDSSLSKDSRIDLRVTSDQKTLLERAASLKGVSLSAYTLLNLIPIAQADIKEGENLTLSNRDRDVFLSALETPPPLKGSLKSAIVDYRQKYES